MGDPTRGLAVGTLCQPGEDGLNGYCRQSQRNYQSAILPFAEIVHWRDPGPHMLKLRSKWRYEVLLERSVASDCHVIGTRFGFFLVRGLRRMPPSARHQVQVPTEPWGVVEPPPPPVEPSGSMWRPGHRQESRRPCPKRDNRHRQSSGRTNNTRRSNAPSSISGEHAKRLADPTLEGRFRCLKSRDQEDVQSHAFCQCPVHWSTKGCRRDGCYHNAQCKRRAADRAASASRVGGAISIQTTSHAAGGAASSSHVGGVSKQIQVATHAEVRTEETQSRAVHVGGAAVQVGAANETQLQTVDQDMADVQTDHNMADVQSWNTSSRR